MKRFLLMLAVCLMATAGMKAQYIDSDARGWRLGWGFDLGMSKVTKCEAKNAFSWGVNILPEYMFGLGYVQSGLLFNSIGMKDMGNGSIDGTLSAYYVQVPLNLGLNVSVSDNACWLIQAALTLPTAAPAPRLTGAVTRRNTLMTPKDGTLA